jgi:RNA polymerase sigma-70 factor (ECF subfamily)
MSSSVTKAGPGLFPVTRHSVVLAARSAKPAERARALEAVIAVYWKPVYKHVRRKWGVNAEDAADFTQEFFTRLIEKEFLDSYDPLKGRLRTFLRTCVDRLFMNQSREAQRIKRGSAAAHVSLDFLDFEEAEMELGRMLRTESPEEVFDQEWIRSLFVLAVQRLRERCDSAGKSLHFRLFERYDLEDSEERPTYEALAAEFSLTSTDVTNYLAFARREFRRVALDQLREMTGSEAEFRREARLLLGIR